MFGCCESPEKIDTPYGALIDEGNGLEELWMAKQLNLLFTGMVTDGGHRVYE